MLAARVEPKNGPTEQKDTINRDRGFSSFSHSSPCSVWILTAIHKRSTSRHHGDRRGFPVPVPAVSTEVRELQSGSPSIISISRPSNCLLLLTYYRAVTEFFAWLDAAGIVALIDIEPLHVATYI